MALLFTSKSEVVIHVHRGTSRRSSMRSRLSASISARTPYRAERSSTPVSNVSPPFSCATIDGNADSAVGQDGQRSEASRHPAPGPQTHHQYSPGEGASPGSGEV